MYPGVFFETSWAYWQKSAALPQSSPGPPPARAVSDLVMRSDAGSFLGLPGCLRFSSMIGLNQSRDELETSQRPSTGPDSDRAMTLPGEASQRPAATCIVISLIGLPQSTSPWKSINSSSPGLMT